MEWKRENLLLYLVTDRSWLKEQEHLERRVELALQAGATMVQLREKTLSYEAFVEEAFAIKKVCQRYQVPFLINDRLDVAEAVDADGVHLGLQDAAIEEARKRLGPGKIIGASAHNVQEALLAERQGASYLGCGAVFGSKTKRDAAVLEKQELAAICRAVKIPVAAIGGIKEENILELKGLGLSGAAVVSAVFAKENPAEAVRELLEKAKAITGENSGGNQMLTIKVNGKEQKAIRGTTLLQFLTENGYQPVQVAVERNGDIVRRSRFGETLLEDGDVIEVVSFVGGG